MRELLVIFGLISLGYFAQSSIGIALNKSCQYYEQIATNVRANSHPPRNRVPLPSGPPVNSQRAVAEHQSRATFEADREQLSLQSASELREVKITQTGPQATRTIR